MSISRNLFSDSDLEDAQSVANAFFQPTPRPPAQPRKNDRESRLKEVAGVLGVSTQAISQIEQRALAKCREWCEANGWRLEDVL
jgi:hypothetical protein